MRSPAIFCLVAAALAAGPAAVAQAPAPPAGSFGGGALVAPPKDLRGAGNAVIGLRALPKRRLEIEATVRARCAGGDISASAKIAADGTFKASGSGTAEPSPGVKVRTTYTIAGAFTGERAVKGTLSATLTLTKAGAAESCKTGTVTFNARKPTGELGKRGAKRGARYYGTTAQRGVATRRPIVLRTSADGRLVTYALFGEQQTCSDGTRSIDVEAPRTNIRIGLTGRVSDRDRDTIDEEATITYVDDRFDAVIGHDGASGSFSLSDRTIDKATGNVLQTCKTGTIKWTAAP